MDRTFTFKTRSNPVQKGRKRCATAETGERTGLSAPTHGRIRPRRKGALCIKSYKNERHLIKHPSPAEDCLILQSNPLQKKAEQSRKKKQPKGLQKSKARALRILQGNPLQKKRSKIEKKTAKRPSKKQKRERLKATQGSLCDQEKLGKKRSGEGSSPLPPSKKQKGCRKGIPSFRSFRLSRALTVQSASKLPKAPKIGTFFGLSAVFVAQQASVAAVLPRIRLCTRLLICSTAHRPRFGRTSAVRSTVHSPCVRPRFSCVSGCVFQPCVIRAFRCASQPCVIRAFRCAPNHTARPRNRPQLWQKVRSPGR